MRSGIEIENQNPAIRPQDDLFAHVNGTWLATATIPEDRARYGAFDMLREASEAAVRELVEAAAEQTKDAEPDDSPAWRVGALYRSFMDVDRVEALGWSPLVPDFAAIAAVADPSGVVRTSAAMQRAGSGGLVGAFVSADAGNPDLDIAYLNQSGLGLPDEEYYRADQHAAVREAYLAYLQKMFTLAGPAIAEAGLDVGTPEQAARTVLDLETRIAAAHWDKVTARDAVKAYNRMTRAELESGSTGFDWAAWVSGIGASDGTLEQVVVRQPDVLAAMGTLLQEVPIADWRAWLALRLINGNAGHLGADVVEANFDFYGRTLSGVPQLKERWKRGVGLIEGLIGEDAGQMYVAEHFPAQAAERMNTLVGNVIEAFRQRIEQLSWMSEQTRTEALKKLAAFRPKIGHPPKWRDYSAIKVDPTDLIGNIRRATAAETDHELAKVGRPVDRDEWLMTPQTVNAYYHPMLNEIVFPAAILQPPFFDAGADDAVNYGGIGAVIAHEIGHGFDDQGSRYDGTGALKDWWTETDRSAFDALSGKLISQFDQLSPREVPEEKVKGGLTVGENIGDLCGLEMSLSAYRIAGGGDEIDGLTDTQRFFIGWGQVWRTLVRPEEAKRLLAIDPHSPADLRANTVRNVDAFHDAFGTAPGDGMWLATDDRVRIF